MMKKLLTTISLALTLCLSLSTVFAAPSINKNGAVKSDSLLINGAKVEGKTAEFKSDEATYKAAGVSTEVIDVIEKVNANPTQLATLVKGVDLTGYSLLTEFQDLSVYDVNTKQLLTNQTNVTVTWEVPNLVKTAKNVKVLHYSTVRNTWEILTPKSVDFDNKTITQEFKDLSPVAVIYQAGDANANKTGTKANSTKTGDSTNVMPFVALGVVALAGIGFCVVRRKKSM